MDLTNDDLMRGDYVIVHLGGKNEDGTEWEEYRIAMIVGIEEYNCADIVIRDDDGGWSNLTDVRVNCLSPIPLEKAFFVLNGFSEDDAYAINDESSGEIKKIPKNKMKLINKLGIDLEDETELNKDIDNIIKDKVDRIKEVKQHQR